MKILVLGDLHFPWHEHRCLEACYEFSKKYKPDLVIQVGDIIDGKAWSRYPKDPDDLSPELEWQQVVTSMAQLNKMFPQLVILQGNHCLRIMTRASEAGLCQPLIRTLNQVFDYKGWKWHVQPKPYVADGITFIHGDELPGNAWQKAQKIGKPLVQGHDHLGYLQYVNTFDHQIFGMSVGCMIDAKSIAARYAARNLMRCWLGWGTITHLRPELHPWLK